MKKQMTTKGLCSAALSLLLVLALLPVQAAEIHTAARAGDVDRVIELIAQGEDIDRRSRGGTPLHIAILSNRKDVVELLIAKGADVNLSVPSLGAPLHVAALRGSAELASLLIASGANVSATDGSGLTPLHYAADKGGVAVAELLTLCAFLSRTSLRARPKT